MDEENKTEGTDTDTETKKVTETKTEVTETKTAEPEKKNGDGEKVTKLVTPKAVKAPEPDPNERPQEPRKKSLLLTALGLS